MKFLLAYLRQHRAALLAFVLCSAVFLLIFALYHVPVMAAVYPAALSMLLLAGFAAVDIRRAWRKHRQMERLCKLPSECLEELPPADSLSEKDYQALLVMLKGESERRKRDMELRYADMVDYYTVWAHQIKTPIASIRLNQQNEDSEFSRQVAEDLQRIEQYIQMALVFLRLDSDTTDYVFQEKDLDEIVKGAVRKFSMQFIRRKIRLQYEPLHISVLTDEKWLSFVVEQVLSNALKYTADGTIFISLRGPDTLCIRDTGIGIAAQDLPRIFEKGYTGGNGRADKTATGLGLYLCKRICCNLGHTIRAESEPGAGTSILIGLGRREKVLE